MNPDQLAELEEERRFLLRSLTDLEREHEFGDVDEHDYLTLKDGYTGRAATVLRAIDDGRAVVAAPRVRRPARIALLVVGVLAFAGLSGWLVARQSGQRLSGQEISGGQPVDELSTLLSSARQVLASDQLSAAQLYRQALDIDPENSEARTYVGWLLALNSRGLSDSEAAGLVIDQAVDDFQRVIDNDPGYADAQCLYGVVLGAFVPEPDPAAALAQIDVCRSLDPPADMLGLVDEFSTSLEAQVTGTEPGDSVPMSPDTSLASP